MTKQEKEVLIIIPAYNEGKTIGALLEQLEAPEIAEIADILVMNDASTDDTKYVVKRHGHACVTHVYNLGYGCGLQIGYKYATRRNYKYVLQMDADGQHDVVNVMQLYKAIKTPDEETGRTPDIVIGSRYMDGSPEYNPGFIKKLAYAMFRRIIKQSCKKKITDPTSGLQILDRRAFAFYARFGNFDDKYPDTNMILQMLMLGYTVKEIPALMHYRTEGVSMHSGIIKPAIYMYRMFCSIIAVWLRIKVMKRNNKRKY